MEKKADDRVNQWLVAGSLAGVSAASMAALFRKVRHMKDIRETYGGGETDDNAIVVTLPRREKLGEDLKVKDKGETGTESKPPRQPMALDSESSPRSSTDAGISREAGASNGQQRRVDGTYGVKYAQKPEGSGGWLGKLDRGVASVIGDPAKNRRPLLMRPFLPKADDREMPDWARITLGTAALLGGGYGAYRVADSIHRKRRLRQLERELDAAKTHYVSRLYGDDGEKRGFNPGVTDVGIAAVALKMLMLTGGSAYLTKKWLDEREHDRRDIGLDIPKPPRIVFRTQPMSEAEKTAEDVDEISDADAEFVKASLGFYVDMLGDRAVLGSDAFKAEAEKSGHTVEGLVKLAQQPGAVPDEVRALLRQPHIRKWFANAMPQLGGGAGMWQKLQGVPILGRIAHWFMDRKLGDPEYMRNLKQRLDPRAWAQQGMEHAQRGVDRGRSAMDDYIRRTMARAGHDVRRQRADAAAQAEPAAPAPEVPAPAPFPAPR